MFGNVFQNFLSHHCGEVNMPIVPQFLLLAFLQERSDIYSLPVLRTLPYHCDLWKIIEFSFTMTSASSLSTCGLILSNPTDLCISSSFKHCLTWSLPLRVDLPCSRLSHCSQDSRIPKGKFYWWRMHWIPWFFSGLNDQSLSYSVDSHFL